ncbi:uncharacterized protein H6S33_006339 [Morchella sextelata]|uniref:uncharacterized protein n=1 Tax=Morchella sextelata TaxID=1174677 RepID=UPI001D05857C|nr:uncharacterized protein H6S33_006339 [Morchella sextelata]KAH0604671.1 hypothetical protein H6S33_006339 [Morchella sextelata]
MNRTAAAALDCYEKKLPPCSRTPGFSEKKIFRWKPSLLWQQQQPVLSFGDNCRNNQQSSNSLPFISSFTLYTTRQGAFIPSLSFSRQLLSVYIIPICLTRSTYTTQLLRESRIFICLGNRNPKDNPVQKFLFITTHPSQVAFRHTPHTAQTIPTILIHKTRVRTRQASGNCHLELPYHKKNPALLSQLQYKLRLSNSA